MDLSAADRLTDLEEKFARAVEFEWERWNNAEPQGPFPPSLVSLMEKAHKAIYSRIGKNVGMDLSEMMKNPEGALVALDKQKALLLKMIEARGGAPVVSIQRTLP